MSNQRKRIKPVKKKRIKRYNKPQTKNPLERAIARAKYNLKNNIDITETEEVIEDPSVVPVRLAEMLKETKNPLDIICFAKYLIKQDKLKSLVLNIDLVKKYSDYYTLNKRIRVLSYIDEQDAFMVESLELSELIQNFFKEVYDAFMIIEKVQSVMFSYGLLLAQSIISKEELNKNPQAAFNHVVDIVSTTFIGDNIQVEGKKND